MHDFSVDGIFTCSLAHCSRHIASTQPGTFGGIKKTIWGSGSCLK